jgi:hypothetical protein
MLAATMIAVFIIPVTFAVVERLARGRASPDTPPVPPVTEGGTPS